ncbi:hypothetical protein ACRAWF_34660 [Streptomyces sp. L7]
MPTRSRSAQRVLHLLADEIFNSLQEALDRRGKNQPARNPEGATKFLRSLLTCP